MRVTWQRNKRVEDFGTELRTQASSLFRTAAAVVWLLSIFQSRRGKRDKPEDVASTCPVSVKTHLQTYFAVFHVVEKKGKKLRPHKRAPKELDRFLILQLGRRERENMVQALHAFPGKFDVNQTLVAQSSFSVNYVKCFYRPAICFTECLLVCSALRNYFIIYIGMQRRFL